jgi:hypothetical protein
MRFKEWTAKGLDMQRVAVSEVYQLVCPLVSDKCAARVRRADAVVCAKLGAQAPHPCSIQRTDLTWTQMSSLGSCLRTLFASYETPGQKGLAVFEPKVCKKIKKAEKLETRMIEIRPSRKPHNVQSGRSTTEPYPLW